jgi:hypothetical protein
MGSLCLIFITRNKSPELDHNHDRPSAAYILYTGINFAPPDLYPPHRE